ncbi:molybdopterin-containing oxidoreductase I, DMSO/TMAO/BSO reductase family, monoheme c-type cytochrome [Campylobacter blaseri]|uniref:Molybdopterin-containing oxidoreductase I, DMSO/TMAO/BSO reductase family, monoheme c-type cytochrome n=1 Tax=Campylobacter blaseri TaxID=2042961 RepID=A0A2P8QYE6_9BACT|nr:hypothetical protein [Campylobacter blaseri]PSM51277.1 hypothetical protein CQ405_08580 [Campylobacter blaseri]PSM52421.1 hypothetical protein CRN67_08585 [Campylobacter blaseri]QKF86250.1 molybdopterin-containing oxidoreductase I, DMSO/TMAO/BSO reductase family, monoheme c-type cytochrome [Campylobacter blaseri]
MKKTLVLLTILSSFAFAKTMYVFDIKSKLFDPTNKSEVGEIYEGTPVKVIKQDGNLTLIEVVGEVTADNESMVAYKKDPLVTFYNLKNTKAQPKAKFFIDSEDLTDGEYASWEEIELMYYDSCSSCHAAHKPKEHKMNEWDAYLSAMQFFAKITDEERDRILRFLQAYASDGIAKEEE